MCVHALTLPHQLHRTTIDSLAIDILRRKGIATSPAESELENAYKTFDGALDDRLSTQPTSIVVIVKRERRGDKQV